MKRATRVRGTAAPDKLTKRELAVLVAISRGRTNAGIARQLDISPGSAKHNVARVLLKLCAADRAHAVRRGFELGLLRGAQ